MMSKLLPHFAVQGKNGRGGKHAKEPSSCCHERRSHCHPSGKYHAASYFSTAFLQGSALTQGFHYLNERYSETLDRAMPIKNSKAFPQELHKMLEAAEKKGFQAIVSWQPHGKAFRVYDKKQFVKKVLPIYFRQSKFTSFQRQLNLYCFRRLTTGNDNGTYYHELFRRDQPLLSKDMVRKRIKGNVVRAAADPESEPDFSQLQSSELVGQPTVIDHVSVGGWGSKDTLEQKSLTKLQLHTITPGVSFDSFNNAIPVSCFSPRRNRHLFA